MAYPVPIEEYGQRSAGFDVSGEETRLFQIMKSRQQWALPTRFLAFRRTSVPSGAVAAVTQKNRMSAKAQSDMQGSLR